MEIFRKNFTSLSINKTVSTFLFTIYPTLTSQVQYNIFTLIRLLINSAFSHLQGMPLSQGALQAHQAAIFLRAQFPLLCNCNTDNFLREHPQMDGISLWYQWYPRMPLSHS